VAFHDLRHVPGELGDLRELARDRAHADEGGDRIAERLRIEIDPRALDDARFLQALSLSRTAGADMPIRRASAEMLIRGSSRRSRSSFTLRASRSSSGILGDIDHSPSN
jgi:hypothetical protein